MNRLLPQIAVIASASLVHSGCFSFHESVISKDELQSTEHHTYKTNRSACSAQWLHETAQIAIRTADRCIESYQDRYQRTLTFERSLSKTDYVLYAIDGALALLGAGLIIAAPYLSDKPGHDPETGEETGSSRQGAYVMGGFFASFGVYALLSIPMAYKSTRPTTQSYEYNGPLEVSDYLCGEIKALSNAPVTASYKIEGNVIFTEPLVTDTDGLIALNPNALNQYQWTDPNERVSLEINTSDAGRCTLDLPLDLFTTAGQAPMPAEEEDGGVEDETPLAN